MLQEIPQTRLILTTVYDSKTKEYGQIMAAKTIDEAIRSFGAACSQENHQFKQFAEDFSLWEIGSYYPEIGKIVNVDNHQIALATDFRK